MPVQETNSGPQLLLRLRREGGAPLGRQLEVALRETIRQGRLAPGQRLPPSRTLAADLGVSRRLVVEAFEQLRAEGWLDARVGAGTYVRRALPQAARAAADRPSRPALANRPHSVAAIDFFPGHPDLAAFPRAAWARAEREALRQLPHAALGYGDPRGLPELRQALAEYLTRVRGLVCHADQVMICQGAVQALGLLVRAAGGAGVRVAVEDPYLPEHRDVLEHAGAEVVPVPVDELGVHDEAVAAARPRLALVTPAHQFPTGVVLSAGRRTALVSWAQRADAALIEDDYDAEYRYDRAPVGALQALAPGQVVYLGSASKTLAPALRLGWMVMPERLAPGLLAAKRYADAGSPALPQATLATLISSGAYERHVRAARRRHRSRRDALRAAVARHLPDATVGGVAAGLHAIVHLGAPVSAAALTRATRERGVRVYPLSLWRADPPPETQAVVLGYAALHPAAIEAGVARLADAWRSL